MLLHLNRFKQRYRKSCSHTDDPNTCQRNTCLSQNPDSLKVNQWLSVKPIRAETNPDSFQWTFNILLNMILLLLLHFRRLGRLVEVYLSERDDWLYDDLSMSAIVACSILERCELLKEN